MSNGFHPVHDVFYNSLVSNHLSSMRRSVADSISIDCPAFLAEGGLCGMDMMDALLI